MRNWLVTPLHILSRLFCTKNTGIDLHTTIQALRLPYYILVGVSSRLALLRSGTTTISDLETLEKLFTSRAE